MCLCGKHNVIVWESLCDCAGDFMVRVGGESAYGCCGG